MTPEQLEAHRVRFEQAYSYRFNESVRIIKENRDEESYSSQPLAAAWEGYKFALADSQRAAPVSAATTRQSPQIRSNITPEDFGVPAQYADRASNYAAFLVSTPQPVEVQPVTPAEMEKLLRGQVKALQDLIQTQNRRTERADRLEKSAQPVALGPLSHSAQFNAAINFAIDSARDSREFLAAWREGDISEWPEFGITPTSAKGGAS